MVASEVSPWAKSGGLADVTGALPVALDALGHRVTTVLPWYRGFDLPIERAVSAFVELGSLAYAVEFHVASLSDRRRVVFVDIPGLFDRPGLYGSGSQDFGDNADRFAMLAAAAAEFLLLDESSSPVDVVHGHDWQTGLLPVLLRTVDRYRDRLGQAALVFTIHNLAYQGLFDRDVVTRFGLPWSVFRLETAEFWGRFSFLKAGVTASDLVTTVSPTYASETRQPDAGLGFDGVLSALGDRYLGILNGIDTAVWDPATDPHVPAHYDGQNLAGKRACKRALLERLGLPVGDDAMERPLVAMVSRLVEQKGLHLVAEASEALMALDATWVFVGQGDRPYETMLTDLARRFPSRVGVHVGFDEPLAHLVEAGADVYLMPSQFEPCGLNQMYSLRYGTVPVVTAVGGLDDTIQPYTTRARHANGFKFKDQSSAGLVRAVRQALRLYRRPDVWSRLVAEGMEADHSWQTSAREYVKVYRRARQEMPLRGAY